MQILHHIDLNLSLNSIPPSLQMPQGDSNSRSIVATLWEGANKFEIPSGAVVMVRFGKPDGTGGLYDKSEAGTEITYAGNTVTAPVASQMLSVSGVVRADIEIYQTGETDQASVRLGTFCFNVFVEAAAYPEDTIISSDYYSIISGDISQFRTAQEQIKEAQKELNNSIETVTPLVARAETAAQEASDSKKAAEGYATNASGSAAAAQSAKTAAETAKTKAEAAKTEAESAKSSAESAAQGASNSKTAAETAKSAAETAKTEALSAKEAAETAAQEAQNFAEAMQECAPYDSTKQYVVGNMATYNGSTYRCKEACKGVVPTDTTYWLLIAKKGNDGAGSGDMLSTVYDPQGKAQDMFNYADQKQPKITSAGLLKGDGSGGVTPAVAGEDYVDPSDLPNVPSASDENPSAAGEASPGTSTEYSRGDHVHPTDTTRQAKITTSGLLKGDGDGGVTSAVKGTDFDIPASVLTLSLLVASWTGESSPYTQTVTLSGGTSTSIVSIQPSEDVMQQMLTDGTNALLISNTDGVFTAKAMGNKPSVDLTIQVTLQEAKVVS